MTIQDHKAIPELQAETTTREKQLKTANMANYVDNLAKTNTPEDETPPKFSVHVKLDVEGSEFSLLKEIAQDAELRSWVRTLDAELHFNYRAGTFWQYPHPRYGSWMSSSSSSSPGVGVGRQKLDEYLKAMFGGGPGGGPGTGDAEAPRGGGGRRLEGEGNRTSKDHEKVKDEGRARTSSTSRTISAPQNTTSSSTTSTATTSSTDTTSSSSSAGIDPQQFSMEEQFEVEVAIIEEFAKYFHILMVEVVNQHKFPYQGFPYIQTELPNEPTAHLASGMPFRLVRISSVNKEFMAK
ncbi:unnamed protein product [Amoebophrya sp. A25]|nr:unnamed protein product [Amoebophrya sp. A25]|eukprot:GSA25T00016397001.1